MPNRNALYPGCAAPVATKYVLTTDNASIDLSTATAGEIHVVFSDGSTAVWTAALSDAAAGTITLTRLHVTTDVPEGSEGSISLQGRVTLPAFAEPVRGHWQHATVLKDGT